MASSAPDSGFYKTLGTLHRAGVSWPDAIRSAAGGRRGMVWVGVAARLESGDSLADCMGPFVDPIDHALIRAGEASGSLDDTFDRLAAWHEEEEQDRQERRTAIAYPVLVALVGSVLMAAPDLMQGRVFAGLTWSVIILVPTFLFAWLATRKRTIPEPGESRRSIPRVGPWKNLVDEADARALAALAACEEAGVPINETVDLAARAGAGGRVAEDLERARTRVAAGDDLAGAWQAIPADVRSRLVAGEHAGSFGTAAQHAAEGLRFDVRQRRKRSLARLPVFMILIVGGLVAWRVISFWVGHYAPLMR